MVHKQAFLGSTTYIISVGNLRDIDDPIRVVDNCDFGRCASEIASVRVGNVAILH